MAVGDPVIDEKLSADTPGVHALVVGVGDYEDAAMPKLESATNSALAFADWLHTKQVMPEAKLGSIAVLASQPSGAALVWQGKELASPTHKNVKKAVDAWFLRAGTNPQNVAVFYFCGHGIELGGGKQSLLLEDVDLSSAGNPFSFTIDFAEFLRGMDCCGARRQVFIIDACRELPAGMARWTDTVPAGDMLVTYNWEARRKLQPRKAPVLQAAAPSQKAWAGERCGWFTEALLTVLEGAGGNNRLSDTPDQYPVNTREIADTIAFLVKHELLASPVGPQTPRRTGDDDFDLHLPNPLVVPVVVTANAAQPFHATCPPAVRHVGVMPPWRSRLPVGDYNFAYGASVHSARISAPGRKVHLP
jgi:hypothetical protein